MSAERPEAGVPEQPSVDGSVPPEPEVVAQAEAEPALPQHTVEPTRTSMVWTMVGIGVVLLFAILVFILQNGQRVRVRFLMVNATSRSARRCCSPPCWARCWCWWRARPGCCSCEWYRGAIAAPTSRPDLIRSRRIVVVDSRTRPTDAVPLVGALQCPAGSAVGRLCVGHAATRRAIANGRAREGTKE